MCVRRLGGRAHDIAPTGEVASGVCSSDVIVVEGVCGKPRVNEGRSGWRADLGEVGAAGALATLDYVAGDADIICARGPRNGDGRLTRGSSGEVGGRGRRGGVGRRRITATNSARTHNYIVIQSATNAMRAVMMKKA